MIVKSMKQNPQKILHIFGRMGRGGAEIRTLEIMRALDPSSFQIHFCTLSGAHGELDDEIRALGGLIFPCSLGLGFPWRFRRIVRAGGYSVVHSHVSFPSGVMLLLAKAEGVPRRIAHFRSTETEETRLYRRVQRHSLIQMLDHFATDIVSVCEGAMASCWGAEWRRDSRCRVIYNGIDTEKFLHLGSRNPFDDLGINPRNKVLLHVGRLDPPKNHLRLVEIFAALATLDRTVSLVLIGRGGSQIEAQIRARIGVLNLQDRVHLVGEREDVPMWMNFADLLILPSLWEGLPGVVLEACAAGLPVVASDIPGVREIAAYFPSVNMLSLNESDLLWANQIMKLLGEGGNREIIQGQFSQSPFTLDKSVRAHEQLWLGGV